MKILPLVPISDLMKIAPDHAHFRPVTREDLVAGSPIFQVRLAHDVVRPLESGQLDADSARAFLPILMGWATVRAQVMKTATETDRWVELMDQIPKVRSGRYPVKIEDLTSPTVSLLAEGKIAYSYYVSPIEVACPLCDARIRFWPPDEIDGHLATYHPDSGVESRHMMPWAKPRREAQPA